MKNTTLLLFILLLTIISSCEHEDSINLTPDGYVPGYAILLATSVHPNGIIKIDAQDHDLKGVNYHFENDLIFNTYEDLFFKIKEQNGIQIAYDIQTDPDELKILDITAIQNIASKIKMNLHNAVYTGYKAHLENNYHVRGHLWDSDDEGVQFFFQKQGKGKEQIDIPEPEDNSIEINGEKYLKKVYCKTQNRKNCQYIYIKPTDYKEYLKVPEKKKIYFQVAPVMINDFSYNYVIDFSDKHVHFGDRKEFDEKD